MFGAENPRLFSSLLYLSQLYRRRHAAPANSSIRGVSLLSWSALAALNLFLGSDAAARMSRTGGGGSARVASAGAGAVGGGSQGRSGGGSGGALARADDPPRAASAGRQGSGAGGSGAAGSRGNGSQDGGSRSAKGGAVGSASGGEKPGKHQDAAKQVWNLPIVPLGLSHTVLLTANKRRVGEAFIHLIERSAAESCSEAEHVKVAPLVK